RPRLIALRQPARLRARTLERQAALARLAIDPDRYLVTLARGICVTEVEKALAGWSGSEPQPPHATRPAAVGKVDVDLVPLRLSERRPEFPVGQIRHRPTSQSFGPSCPFRARYGAALSERVRTS